MTIKHIEEYRDSTLARQLSEKIKHLSRRKIRLMEVQRSESDLTVQTMTCRPHHFSCVPQPDMRG